MHASNAALNIRRQGRHHSFLGINPYIYIRTPQAPALPKQEGLLCPASQEGSKYRTRDHIFVCEVRRHVSLTTTLLHVVPDAHPRDIAIDMEVIEISRSVSISITPLAIRRLASGICI